ncbi:hypothetical protein AYO42_03490 [Rhizomicrobium sp. SCGC AG-212-E05]|nr:hypothetical protein AYO42_03490 [Rhizomicrobium sp. SCGC AG-212-E05]
MKKRKRTAEPSLSERIMTAKVKTGRVVDHLRYLLALHANNAIVSYSPTLAAQIPTSYAANAFRTFQEGLHRFEIVRLCALWDGVDPDKENIPTIVDLIDRPEVLDALADETVSAWGAMEGVVETSSEDAEVQRAVEETIKASNLAFGKQQAEKAQKRLRGAITEARNLTASGKLASIMNLRDKSLAHSLAATRREKDGPIEPMKVGYERDILNASVEIVDALHIGINNASFDFTQTRHICEKNAKALWEACTFDIKR